MRSSTVSPVVSCAPPGSDARSVVPTGARNIAVALAGPNPSVSFKPIVPPQFATGAASSVSSP